MLIPEYILEFVKPIKNYFDREYGILLTNKQVVSHCIFKAADTVKGSAIDKQSRVRISSRYGSSSKNVTLSPADEKRLLDIQKSLGLYKTTLSFILSMLILEQGKLYMELCRLKRISIK